MAACKGMVLAALREREPGRGQLEARRSHETPCLHCLALYCGPARRQHQLQHTVKAHCGGGESVG